MPELPHDKPREHPWKTAKAHWGRALAHLERPETPACGPAPDPRPIRTPYAELATTSNFTFLTGASHPDELVERAKRLGHAAAVICDAHSLAGAVRAHVAAKESGIPLAIGARIDVPAAWTADAPPGRPGVSLLLYPTSRPAYANLCRLLTLGKRRAPKGQCRLELHDVIEHQAGLLCVVRPPAQIADEFVQLVEGLARVFDDDRLSVGACFEHGPDDQARVDRVADLCEHVGVPMVALGDALYHDASRRPLQDMLTCIRLGVTLDQAGLRLQPAAERRLRSPEEMLALFSGTRRGDRAVERAARLALRAAAFSLDQLRYEYPSEVAPEGQTPMQHLTALVRSGAERRYAELAATAAAGATAPEPGASRVPQAVRAQIDHELRLIDELGYAPYFLTVHDLVAYARSRGILCQGRGAAANSAVCYCLGVTSVDPSKIDLLFERFISKERNEPPDIDIDFEHERREEVIQYLYAKYGRHRAALTAVVITYRGRSAIREVGKALGLSLDLVDRLAKGLDWWEHGAIQDDRLRDLGLNPADPTLRHAVALATIILGFPRHLSQHVGGFVITRGDLCDSVPIENAAMQGRTVIEWDKDDIEALGMLKVDVLGLGMLSALSKAMAMVNDRTRPPALAGDAPGPGPAPAPPLQLHTIPQDDPAVYDMACAADTVGVFQIESRAQMTMLPRLKPRCFYDLVIEVALVRPGPIVGDMVHPYLRRRNGQEPVVFPDEKIRAVLGKTLGVPLFQEQAMKLAMVAAGFTPGEADQLRRAIAAWKTKQKVILAFGQRIVEGMVARGYDREFALRCFNQLKGFSEYGFPESHAASFANLVYASLWLKRHHPAEFCAALINSQPMGFYAPAQLVKDARDHGVSVFPADAMISRWDCTIQDDPHGRSAVRLGLRLVAGLERDEAEKIAAARTGLARPTLEALWRASGVKVRTLRLLAAADAFASLDLTRQQALWAIRGLSDETLPLFDQHPPGPEAPAPLPEIAPRRQVAHDYAATGLSLKAHPMSFLRDALAARGVLPAKALRLERACPHGASVSVAGMVLVRQRPSTAKGVVFITIEDETGVANLIVRPKVFKKFRAAARHSVLLRCSGTLQRQGPVVHVMAGALEDLGPGRDAPPPMSRDFH